MKIKSGYMLRDVAGTTVVVPLDGAASFGNMLKLNATGKLLWERLSEGAEKDALLAALMQEYEIDAETASHDLDAFLDALARLNVLE